MAAGTVYAKRYGAGFTDGDNTKQVDAQFLNAVEAALLQLIGAAPTADGQVAQWDNANTRFGPALLLNKNVDPAAAIASSKIDFTGANALTNAAIAGAAAIARSKLNFGSGLVDADIAAAAALGIAKLAGYPNDATKVLKGDATWGTPSGIAGTELDYAQIVADVTGINATTEGTAATVITGTSQAYDATKKNIEVYWPQLVATAGSPAVVTFVVLRGATVLGQHGFAVNAAGGANFGGDFTIQDTPGAATFSYVVKAFVDAGTVKVRAAAGGSGLPFPAHLRVTKA